MNGYAPEYTKQERIIFLLKHTAWVAPLFAVTKVYFFSWFDNYVARAHCYNYGEFTGTHVVFYGLFVGLPLLSALLLLLVEGARSIKVILLGQNPLPNEKVFKPTKYQYGLQAKIKPFIFFVVILFFVGFSIKGFFWANDMISMAEKKVLSQCMVS